MDTPERKKAGGSPISKFEDSPGFSYFNTLSPIVPVKSVHSAQTFQSLSFAAIASVFSSPDVQESMFLKRNPFTDLIKEDTFSHNLDGSNICHEVSNDAKLSACKVLPQEDSNITCSLNEATIDPPDECSTQAEFSQSMHCANGSPTHNSKPFYGIKFDSELGISSHISEMVQSVQDGHGNTNSSVSFEINLNVKFHEDQKKAVASGCDWEKNLASANADDLLIFYSEMMEERHDNISLDTHPNASFGICIQNYPDDSLMDHDGKTGDQPGMNHAAKLLSDNYFDQVKLSEQNQKTEAGVTDCVYLSSKIDSQQAPGMRRRCLVFEAPGVSERNLRNNSIITPSVTLLTKERATSNPLNTSMPCILPGIGLHLNALASSSKDKLNFHENKVPVREIICKPCSACPFPPAEVGEKNQSKSFELEQIPDPLGREVEIVHSDVLQTPAPPVEESTCPQKKRRKIENGGDSEGCRHCSCKKSKCLKLYCECFAAGTYCIEPCSCQGCFNKPIHEEIVLANRKQIESRNPLAFAPKVIQTSEDGQDTGEDSNKTPASARHKKGCNCKKSNCLKKYCECYQGGVGCSSSCRCESCRNTFGRKDGLDEVECDGEVVDCENEKVKLDEGQNNVDIPKIEGCHLSEGALAKPLFPIGRASIRYTSLSTGKTSRSSIRSQLHIKSENQQAHCKNNSNIQIFQEDDTPEILRGNSSPCSTMKVVSPNGKRVSPPHNGLRMSPYRKGGRRLILKSIPSFPSLNDNAPADISATFSDSHFNSRALR